MNIAVVCVEPISNRPPVQQLVHSLLCLGHNVLLISRNLSSLPSELLNNQSFCGAELGDKNLSIKRYLQAFKDKKRIRSAIESSSKKIDLIWCATEMSGRDSKKALKNYPYILQMPELVEFVPAFRIGNHYIPDKAMPMVARSARRVIVPEYNRAHIQQTWWNLPETPLVLPNKSDLNKVGALREDDKIAKILQNESRKILLYQGGFTPDRDLLPFAKALNLLDDEYSLYLMGPINGDEEQKTLEKILLAGNHIHYLGFVEAPKHRSYTKYGHIGILPYSPLSDHSRASALNALYCAPNKIWEYSEAGLPMLGSDVPGLTSLFSQNDLGVTVNQADPHAIAEGIKYLSRNYNRFSHGSRNFYDSIDPTSIIDGIITQAFNRK